MPTATDLVTDLPADFEVFGQAVATSMADLLGGTSGQILAKNSNTDMDFVWIANDQGDITAVTAGTGITGGGTSGAVTITNDMATTITASGDIVVGTGSATYDNLPIGTTGQVLTADTTVSPYKVKWATPSAGQVPILTKAVMGADFTTSSASYVDITGMTITRTPVSATNNIQIIATMNINPGADRITRFRLVYGATNSNIIAEYLLAKAGYNTTLTIVFNVTNVAASSTVFKMQMLTDGSTTVYGNTSGYLNSFSVLEVY